MSAPVEKSSSSPGLMSSRRYDILGLGTRERKRVATDRALLSVGFFLHAFEKPTVTKVVTVATTWSPAALSFGQSSE